MSPPSVLRGARPPRAAWSRPRWLLLGLLLLAPLAWVALDLQRFSSLDTLKASHQQLLLWQAQSGLLAPLLFAAVYVAMAALSLPVTVLLTVAAGALFGFWVGGVLVLLSATVGATLCMLLSRLVLRDWVAQRWQPQLQALERGLARDGAWYLLSLRLLPLVPFFMLNLLIGLAPMRIRTYFWVTLVGIAPASLIFVNAGTALAQVDSLAAVLTPRVIAALVLLAALPLVSRGLLAVAQARRVAARHQGERPRRFDRNLVVIGGGAGGLVTAYMAAALKARVTLVEAHRLGGECLYTGCVPSKALIQAARLAQQVREAGHFGVKAGAPEVDWPKLMQRVRDVITAIEPHDSVERYTQLGVEVRQGRARVIDAWTVEIEAGGHTERLSTRAIVLATGSRPLLPELPGLDALPHVTSDTLWDHLAALPSLPRHIVMLGGGAMGCELSQAFARLGAEVTLVERAGQLLVREDEDVAQAALQALQAAGVRVLLQSQALRGQREEGGASVLLATPQGELRVECELGVLALGRRPRVDGLGLEALGLDLSQGLRLNAFLQTDIPSIYAVGDLTGTWQLTHAAAHQGWHAAFNALLGLKKLRADRPLMPQTLFLEPEIARVGLNEREAQAQGLAFEVTRYDLSDLDRVLIDTAPAAGAPGGFVKLLTAPGSDRLLGVTIVGPQAGELLAEYALAMKHGLGLNKVLASIHAYPTLAEANKYAAGVWKRAHQPAWALGLLERFHAWRRG